MFMLTLAFGIIQVIHQVVETHRVGIEQQKRRTPITRL